MTLLLPPRSTAEVEIEGSIPSTAAAFRWGENLDYTLKSACTCSECESTPVSGVNTVRRPYYAIVYVTWPYQNDVTTLRRVMTPSHYVIAWSHVFSPHRVVTPTHATQTPDFPLIGEYDVFASKM